MEAKENNIAFDVEKRFQAYCRRVDLDLDGCPPIQVIEMRRAFFAGASELMIYLQTDVSNMSEGEGVEQLDAIFDQVKAFWERQAKHGAS